MAKKYNENVVAFRCSTQWYKEFLNYLTKQGIEKRVVLETLLQLLFREMSDKEFDNFSAREKFERAINKLTNI